MNCIAFLSDTAEPCKDQMDVISHKDELVYLKPLLSLTITNDVQQQVAERIGLQYESSSDVETM